MASNKLDQNYHMLKRTLSKKGYDCWWHNFTGFNRKTGEPRTFFIEYIVCGTTQQGNNAILGQPPKSNGIAQPFALMKVGTWGKGARQLHNYYPLSKVSSSEHSFGINIGNCTLSEHHMRGSCKVTAHQAAAHPEALSDVGEMRWDIRFDNKITFGPCYGSSKVFKVLSAFENLCHADGLKTEYSGEIILDGESYNVITEKSYGYSNKNQGRTISSPWLRISSCDMRSRASGQVLSDSALEFGGVNPKGVGSASARRLLGCLYYEGLIFEYNDHNLSKLWTGSKIDFSFTDSGSTNVWNITAQNRASLMELKLECPKEEMLVSDFEVLDGRKVHSRLWTGGTGYGTIKLYHKDGKKRDLIDYIDIRSTGCEYGEYMTPSLKIS